MIPVFDTVIGEEEIAAVVAALRAGEISGSFGESIPRFEQEFADYCGMKYGVATSSGTTALHLAVTAAGLGAGDEVLVSASTNIATALAVVHNQAVVVPVDSEDRTWNLDLALLDDLVTPRTRAIIPVHLYGHPVDMDELMEFAQRRHLLVIEDCAESHGATCRGRMTGSFGDMSCFSFYANKVITTGEGGMVLTNDADLARRLRLLRNLAFTEPRFWHEEAGFNFRMTGMQAALGRVQLGRIEEIVAQKRRVAHTYNRRLSDVPGLQLPPEETWARNVYWMYAVAVGADFGVSRDQLARGLRERGIDTRTFFCPMNLQPCLRKVSDRPLAPCPVAERLWRTGLYLPSAYTLTTGQLEHIAQAIRELAERQQVPGEEAA
jgi:perosamine synthetase